MARSVVLAFSIPGHTSDSGGTQEETLEIEYIESVMPPTKLAALPHEEWVSSISCSIPGSAPLTIVILIFSLRALTLLRQPLPHGFIRRCITRIQSRPVTLPHCALPRSSNHVLRRRTTTTTTSFFHRRRGSTITRRNRLTRSHSAALAYIARRDSYDLNASRDVTLARCTHRRCGV
jgi:hypothetical protein